MMSLTPFLVFALLGQTAPPLRIAPETLAWLRKGGSDNLHLTEALLGIPATADTVAPKEATVLIRKDLAQKQSTESWARVVRQLKDARISGTSMLLRAGKMPVRRTVLLNGDLVYDFTFSSALLTNVSFDGNELGDEKTTMEVLSKIVLSKLRIPVKARSPISGSLRKIPLANGHWIWGGVLEFGHAPDANGVYKISDPKWYDSASVWTDGEVLYIQYDRDDTVMGAADNNPPKTGG